jgi:O-antigen/teichoic acid export membrane protein
VGSAVALTLGAEAIVGVLFGSAYLPGALTLQILAWAMVADLCAGPFGEVIFVSRQPLTRYIPAMAGLAGLNLALNLWLAPRWSHVGAAVAALVTALTGLAVRTVWVRRLLEAASPSLPATLWRPALAALGMAGTLVVMRPAGFWLALLPAGLVYGALLVVTGAVRLEEIARATRAIGWRRLVGR